jgi:uncharacterized membrane protein YeiH
MPSVALGGELFIALDLAGTFAFALSGAVAARDRALDGFGVVFVAFVAACGGGVIRDLCLGAVPPVGLADWRYLAVALLAAALATAARSLVARLLRPVALFDAVGLSLFAVTGAQKAIALGHGAQVAILLGVVTAVGGGMLRDVLLARVPAVLQREIYASAALLGAAIEVGGLRLGWESGWRTWTALAACAALRLLSIHRGWHLPRMGAPRSTGASDEPGR